MAEITWHNISNSGGESATNIAQANGIDTVMNAFNPLYKILDDRQAIEQNNWNATAAQNTKNMNAQIRKAQDIGEFNKLDAAGAFSEENFSNQFGAQYDPSSREATLGAYRKTLESNKLNELMPAALAVADKEKDLGAGGSFLEKQMAGAGFNAPMMQETINNFMVSNTAREQQYAKDNKNIVESFLSTAPSPESPQQANDILAKAQQAGVKNLDLLRDRLGTELNDFYIHEKYGREEREEDRADARLGMDQQRLGMEQQRLNMSRQEHNMAMADRSKARREQANTDAALAKASDLIGQGANPMDVFRGIKNSLPGSKQLALFGHISDLYTKTSSLLPEQQKELEIVASKTTGKIEKYQNQLAAIDTNYKKKRDDLTGITPTIMSLVEKSKASGGVVPFLMKDMSDTGWEPSDVFPGVNTGKRAVEKQLNAFRNEVTNTFPDISTEEADAILIAAYQDSNSFSKAGKKGLNPESMKTALENRITLFNKGEAIDAERTSVMSKGASDLAQLQENGISYIQSLTDSIKTGNRTGEPGDIVKSLKNADDKVLGIDESFGIVGQLKAQKKADTDALFKKKTDAEATIAKEKEAAEAELKRKLLPGDNPIGKLSADNLIQYANEYKEAVSQGGAPVIGTGLSGFIGEKYQPTDAKYNRSGEDDLTALLRQKGVEAGSLKTRKQIVGGLKLKYPDATEKELIEVLTKALNK